MSGQDVLSLREMLQGLFHFWDEHITKDGAWWILALDSVLLIPLIFAVFFYPVAVLMLVVAVLLAAAAAVGLTRVARRARLHRQP